MKLHDLIFICFPALVWAGTNDPKKKLKVDIDHLKHDFLNIFGSWFETFSDNEVDFRYFAAHDYDGNKKLDGLELFVALGHDSHHEEREVQELQLPEEIERQVDDIFTDHDANNDGYLDYKEFLSVQRTYPEIGGGNSSVNKDQQEL